MRITLLGVLTGIGIALLLLYVVQQVQEANQVKAETDEQSKTSNNAGMYQNRLG